MTYGVSPYGGVTLRLLVTDCLEQPIPAGSIAGITYTVYAENYGERKAVTGHEKINVPTACYLEEMQTSSHGGVFNFEHRISAANAVPFPDLNRKYAVVYIFTDTAGEPHPHEILCYTETT